VTRETLLDGFISIDRLHLRHRLFAGGWTGLLQREVKLGGKVAAVIPYDPVRDELVLIEQFRIGPFAADDPEPWLTEIVAGMIEDGEVLEDVVRREAREEAGIEVSDITHALEFYASPGAISEHMTLYCARTDTASAGGIHGVAEEGEDIMVIVMTFDQVMAALDSGRINGGPVIAAVQWLALHRDEIRERWLS